MERENPKESNLGDMVFDVWVDFLQKFHPCIIVNRYPARPINLALFFTNSAKAELIAFETIMDMLYSQVLMTGIRDGRGASVFAVIDYREKKFYAPYGWIFLDGFSDFIFDQGKSTLLDFADDFVQFLNYTIQTKTVKAIPFNDDSLRPDIKKAKEYLNASRNLSL